MKFEQVLQIYWTKGLLFGGRVISFETNWRAFGSSFAGIGYSHKFSLSKRFELGFMRINPSSTFLTIDKETIRSINRVLSQMSSVNYQIHELHRLNLIRLFLIKSFRGKAQAFGKPARGQRTWSNAWTSYLYNKELRVFIAHIQNHLNKNKQEEKINYKLLKKKTHQTSQDPSKKKIKTKKGLWF